MEMGSSGGGGMGFGLLFDTSGLGLFGSIILIVAILGISCYCNMQEREQQRGFCTNVCAQYHDVPVIQGTQCYCQDSQGIYDPAFEKRGSATSQH